MATLSNEYKENDYCLHAKFASIYYYLHKVC
jgi:hypothetical protein